MGAILGGVLDGGAAQWAAAALLLLVLTGLAVVGTWLVVVDLREHRLPGDIVCPAWIATAAAFVLGGLAALVVVVRDRGDLQTRRPFGPALFAGAAAALVVV